jgi:hypothetical protein
VVQLRFLHASLSILVVKKHQNLVEGLLGVGQHVGEGAALTILLKIVAGEGYFGHDRVIPQLQ